MIGVVCKPGLNMAKPNHKHVFLKHVLCFFLGDSIWLMSLICSMPPYPPNLGKRVWALWGLLLFVTFKRPSGCFYKYFYHCFQVLLTWTWWYYDAWANPLCGTAFFRPSHPKPRVSRCGHSISTWWWKGDPPRDVHVPLYNWDIAHG